MVEYTESGNTAQPTSDEKASVSESIVIPANPDEKTRVDYELTHIFQSKWNFLFQEE